MPCTNASHEVMMQYHDWDITIILNLMTPRHSTITFVATVLLATRFCYHKSTSAFVCKLSEKLNYILAKQRINSSGVFVHQVTANYSPSWVQTPPWTHLFFYFWNLFDTPYCFQLHHIFNCTLIIKKILTAHITSKRHNFMVYIYIRLTEVGYSPPTCTLQISPKIF